MERQRILWLDTLKGIGIILVVIGHIYKNELVVDWIYSFHMAVFFWAGGYIVKDTDFFVGLKKRVQTIVVPYFIFGMTTAFYWFIVERVVRHPELSLGDAFLAVILGEYRLLKFNIHLWFLPCFFLMSVIFDVFIKVGKKINVRIGNLFPGTISLLMMIYFVCNSIPDMIWGIEKVFQYIIFFAFGYYTNKLNIISQIEFMLNNRMLLLAVFSFTFFTASFLASQLSVSLHWFWIPVALIGIVASISCALLIQKDKVVQYLGRCSLVTLCLHGPIYRALIFILIKLLNSSENAIRNNVVFVFIIACLTLTITSFLNYGIRKSLPWILGVKRLDNN